MAREPSVSGKPVKCDLEIQRGFGCTTLEQQIFADLLANVGIGRSSAARISVDRLRHRQSLVDAIQVSQRSRDRVTGDEGAGKISRRLAQFQGFLENLQGL